MFSVITLILLFIKNKLINFVLAISEKTNTVYDELLLHSIKVPSSYLIIIGYILISIDDFIAKGVIDYSFTLSSFVGVNALGTRIL